MRDVSACSAWPAVDAAAIDAVDAFDSTSSPGMGWASLLEWFYARAELEMPRLEQVKPKEIPQPYRTLLVHSADMTPTLEKFFEEPLGLTALSRDHKGDSYRREVVLTVGGEKRPVLYGVIRIALARLPKRTRERVLEEQLPLGGILREDGIPHLSWPQAFFRSDLDPHMAGVLALEPGGELYGRRNVLVDGSRRLLAEVIELLRPVNAERGRPRPQQ